MIHEHMSHMHDCACKLDAACHDLEAKAKELEDMIAHHTPETPVEELSMELLEEGVDLLCALARSQCADSKALHHHLWTYHKVAPHAPAA